MSCRILPDFQNAIEWNLVARASYVPANTPLLVQDRLPRRSYLIENSHALIIAISTSQPRPNWFTGGWASMILPFLPSSTTAYPAAVGHEKQWISLGQMNLTIWPRFMPTWILNLDFPYWLPDASVEIWRYDGTDLDVFDRLNSLEQTLLN